VPTPPSPQPLFIHHPAMTPEKEADIREGRFVKEMVFRTVPSANKLEIRQILERVYNLEVEEIRTLNYEGRRRQTFSPAARAKQLMAAARGRDPASLKLTRPVMVQDPDWKKVFVTFKGGEGEGEGEGGSAGSDSAPPAGRGAGSS